MNKKAPSPFQKLHHYLVPPGHGVFTVHTGQEKRSVLGRQLWKTNNPKEVEKKFFAHLQGLRDNKLPAILGICSDSGGGILRGANWGPLYLREHFYSSLTGQQIKKKFFELGDIRIVPHLLHDKYLNKKTIIEVRKALYGQSPLPLAVSPLSIAEDTTETLYAINPDLFILGLGGDHSISYPLVKSFFRKQKSQKKLSESALIHFDAHTDLLTSRLGIDLCFGSWAAHIIKYLASPQHLVRVGIRSSGKERNHWENKFGHIQWWASELRRLGPVKLAMKIREHLKALGVKNIYLSFDVDAFDSSVVAKTGTPEAGGLLPHHIPPMFEIWSESFKLAGMDIVEVAPMVNPFDEDRPDKDSTFEACQIVLDHALAWQEHGLLSNGHH